MFVSVIQYLVLFSVVAKILLIMKQASSPKRQRLDSPDAPKNVKSVYFVMFRPGTLHFMMYRSGTSRGLYFDERCIKDAERTTHRSRDEIVSGIMGSGHSQQLEGFGGGNGPTSKAVIVGQHATETSSVTFEFLQCNVETKGVDRSHGDCGNMLAAVGAFALEKGLVTAAIEEVDGNSVAKVKVYSKNTDSVYIITAQIDDEGRVLYEGDCKIPGVPRPAAPVSIAGLGLAGAQTQKLLPTGWFRNDFGIDGDGKPLLEYTCVDFARALIIVRDSDLMKVLKSQDSFVRMSKEQLQAEDFLNKFLESIRCHVGPLMGMGDVSKIDAPKIMIVEEKIGEQNFRVLTLAV